MNYDRCANAFNCFMKLKRDLTKNGDENKMKKLCEYERNGDAKVVENTIYTIAEAHIGFGTENKDEYDKLKEANTANCIILTNRDNIPGMKPIQNTQKLAQVQGYTHPSAEDEWKLTTDFLPCTCKPCREIPSTTNKCLYKDERIILRQFIENIVVLEVDPTGISSMNVAEIKEELRAREILLAVQKIDLAQQLREEILIK